MTSPTSQQLALATTLLAENDRLNAQVLNLTRIKIMSEEAADDRRHDFLSKSDFERDPTTLAGAIEWARRSDPRTARFISSRYQMFLKTLIKHWDPDAAPISIDYAQLPERARPCVLAPFLNILVGGRYPYLCFQQTDITRGRLVYVTSGGPAHREAWLPHLPAINAWLGGHWVFTEASATTITLSRQQPLPKVIPYESSMLKRGALFLGFDADTQQPVHIPFSDLSSGTYSPGISGSGKTNALNVICQSLFNNLHLFSDVWLVDGKQGVSFEKFRRAAPGKVHTLYDELDLWHLTEKLVHTMKQRNIAQREAGIEKATSNFVAVVIDEMATYAEPPNNDKKSDEYKRYEKFLRDLATLAGKGRSTGLRLFITSQRPIDSQMPMTVRANCQSLLCFRMNNSTDSGIALGDDKSIDPRSLSKGHAFYRDDDGFTRRVQFPLAPPQQKRGRA